jgi:hypothetical protein
MRSLLGLLLVLAACDSPLPFEAPACPDFSCHSDADCLEGFQCAEGACALPISCGDLPDVCPPATASDFYNNCLWTGCECYAGSAPTPPPPPPPPPPSPSCGGTVTCDVPAPACPAGDVPAILDGCYAGSCLAIATCDVPPACAVLTHEPDCLARTDCRAEYEGLDCVDPSGQQCTPGDASCTCASFVFTSCDAGS